MERRTTTAQGKTTAETERGRQAQDQVSSNGDWGERRKRDGYEEIGDTSEGWSGGSAEDLAV